MSSSSPSERPRGVALLGSGGSIGRQALDVLTRLAPSWLVVAIATGSQAPLLEEQARRFHPAAVAFGDETPLDLPTGTRRIHGPDALVELATRDDVDLVLVATGGVVSLRPVLAALRAGKVVATANKETLVAGGHLVMAEARARAAQRAASVPHDPLASPLGWLRPIDSEHSAIWQCLVGEEMSAVAALILTASGGPFLEMSSEDFAGITPAMALRHPTWSMGAKITIDSATLANKGLEVIEAHWLYDMAYPAIDVVIHPQSVVHSMVELVDGSLIAQLGVTDMRLPIQYAFSYPDRWPGPLPSLNLAQAGRLDFEVPDTDAFPCLRLAFRALEAERSLPVVLNAANEIAVARFLDGRLAFTSISHVIERAMDAHRPAEVATLAEVRAVDRWAREYAQQIVGRLELKV
jgi:1-deoxy-D-xylulose-5-phosphate reductoisomerase